MLNRIVLLIVMAFFFQSLSFADEKPNIEDKMIAGTLRTMARAYIATADIEKLKANNIAKINRLSEERFNKRYSEVYPSLKSLPPKLKTRYGIAETFTKSQAVQIVTSMDKKKLYELIEGFPDTVIAKQFRKYWSKETAAASDRNFAEQASDFWSSIVGKITRPPAAVGNKK